MTISRAGKINKQSRANGFTLLELLITIVIVGLIMGLVVGQVGKVFSRDMKSAARHLSSTIRYLYNKSATEGVTLRLVLDLDDQSYRVEGTTQRFTLTKEEEEVFRNQKKEQTKKESEGEVIQPKEAQFSPQESYLLKSVQLPKGIYFKDVYAEHQIERIKEGKAYIYFFPQGYVERSVINLRDAKDEIHYSLQVNPISGSVKIESNYKEPEIER